MALTPGSSAAGNDGQGAVFTPRPTRIAAP